MQICYTLVLIAQLIVTFTIFMKYLCNLNKHVTHITHLVKLLFYNVKSIPCNSQAMLHLIHSCNMGMSGLPDMCI